MPPGFDYSKWDNIELSDDEDDVHPNIDKDAWFRLKHRTRVEKDEDNSVKEGKLNKRLEQIRSELAVFGEAGQTHTKALKLKKEADQIEADLAKMRKDTKWNADNMCKTTENRGVVTGTTGPDVGPEPRLGPEAGTEGYCEFIEQNEALLEQFIELGSQDLEASRDFLREHGGTLLQGEHAETYLLLDCLEKEMNGQHDAMVLSARQNQLLTQLREFSRSAGRPARDGVVPIFEKIIDDEGTADSFNDAVQSFIARIVKRAPEKKKEMDAAARSEEDVDPDTVGPGGLTPDAVFATLPEEMQQAFITKDMQRLMRAVESLPAEEAKYHMRRCEDSGLWVPTTSAGTPPYRQ